MEWIRQLLEVRRQDDSLVAGRKPFHRAASRSGPYKILLHHSLVLQISFMTFRQPLICHIFCIDLCVFEHPHQLLQDVFTSQPCPTFSFLGLDRAFPLEQFYIFQSPRPYQAFLDNTYHTIPPSNRCNMDLMADNRHVSLTPAQSYTETQWETKRSLITKLYRDDAKPLQQLRLVLAQHNFRPT